MRAISEHEVAMSTGEGKGTVIINVKGCELREKCVSYPEKYQDHVFL